MQNMKICNEVNQPVKQEVSFVKNENKNEDEGQQISFASIQANMYALPILTIFTA